MTGKQIGNSLMITDDFGNVLWVDNPIPTEAQITAPCQINHDLLAAYAPHLLEDEETEN